MIPDTTQRCAGCLVIDIPSQMHYVAGEGYYCADCKAKRDQAPRLAFYRWLYVTARRLTEWPGRAVELHCGEEIPAEAAVAGRR